MKKIEKGDAPEFFSEFVAKEHPVGWDDVGPVRQYLRKHILREQYGLCAYTEIRITSDEKCHIDHFRTRNLFPGKVFDYRNLLVAFTSDRFGARHKDGRMKQLEDYDLLIDPVQEDPSRYLEFSFTGEVLAVKDCEKGRHTIEAFNLNERSLVRRRKSAVCSLLSMRDVLTEDEVVDAIGEFGSMLRQLYYY